LTGGSCRPTCPTFRRPASASRCARRSTVAASIISTGATRRPARTAARSIGATYSPRCAREIERIGSEIAATKNLPFRAATDGETVSGKFTGTVQLSSGKFAVVEQSHEFTLVPWCPVIDRQLGREVSGIVQGGSVSWQLGRSRGLAL